MTPSLRDREALYESQGQSPREARFSPLVSSIRDAEAEQAAKGVDYDDARVRLAQVHTREDVALLCAYARELLGIADAHLAVLRQIRWAVIALTVIVLWRVL